jgi:glucose-1-phosphate thymidylyltransferase
MKAIIPVAGVGTRLRPHTHTQPKALVPVAGKAILGHIIDNLEQAGVTDLTLIIGYLADKIEAYVASNYPHLNINFVVQEPREGLAHALSFARDYIVSEKEILIVLGDTIVNLDLQAFMKAPQSVLGVKKVDRPGLFGVAELDHEGNIRKLVEKPLIPKSNLALVGIYKIANPKLLIESVDYLIKHKIMTHGEYHLTDALMLMVEKGEKMTTLTVDNWFDCGKKQTLLEANAILLNRKNHADEHPHRFNGTIIIPPVSIGSDCRIENSIIGPNVAIGDNSVIYYSIIKNTIIGTYSELHNTVLEDSIIGNDSSLKGICQSLNIGDNTEINFSK